LKNLNENSGKKQSKALTKAEQIRFLKKVIIFCFGYIIVFSAAMVIIYCVKGDYPETLVTVTFAYFSLEVVASSLIKIFEKKPKEIPPPEDDAERNYEDYK